MRICATFSLLISPLTSVLGQLSSLPPSSAYDGVIVHSPGTAFTADSPLEMYKTSGDGDTDRLATGAADSKTGTIWSSNLPVSVQLARQTINSNGGSMRAIFLGETAEWRNDLGYSRSGNPEAADAYTVFRDMQTGADGNLTFGQYFEVTFAPGMIAGFDFWLNTNVSIYSVFDPPANLQLLWAQTPIQAATWHPATQVYQPVDTYLLSFEDWPITGGADRDFSDLRLALQFYDASGTPIAQIPEPVHSATALFLATASLLLARKLRLPTVQKC